MRRKDLRKVRAVSVGALSAGAVLAVCGCFLVDQLISADVTGRWDLSMEGQPYGELRLVQQGLTATSPDDLTVFVTVGGFEVTVILTVDLPVHGVVAVVCTGILVGDTMMGGWVGTGGGDPIVGTWSATLTTRALVDVSGTWNSVDDLAVGSSGTTTATLSMNAAGSVTGFYDPSGDNDPVTGEVYGFDLTLTVEESGRTITIDATLDAAGTSASGTWSDSDGESDGWLATKP